MGDEPIKIPGNEIDRAIGDIMVKGYEDLAQPSVRLIGQSCKDWLYIKTSRLRKRQMVAEHEERMLKLELDAKEKKKAKELIERMAKIERDNLQEPPLGFLLSLAESAAGKDDDPLLRERYHNLLASSMDKSREMYAHPAFPSFLDQLSADDVKVFEKLVETRQFPIIRLVSHYGVGYVVLLDHISILALSAGCDHPEAVPAYLQNLDRLGLITITYDENIILPDSSPPPEYREIFSSEVFASDIKRLQEEQGEKLRYKHGLTRVTPLGDMFFEACKSPDKFNSSYKFDVAFSTTGVDSYYYNREPAIDGGRLDDD